MGRAKLSMELITKEKTRNTTYQNRKHGIIKKANELCVLCDVNTLIIFYPPDHSNHPEIWPQNPDQINNMIRSYKQEKNKNGKRLAYDLEDYFQTRKRKMEDQLVKARVGYLEAKYPTWFDDLNSLSEWQLRQFSMRLERKKYIVTAHLHLKKRNFNVPMPSNDYLNLDQLQMLMSHGAPNLQMWSGFELGNNQPANQYMGSNPSLDQVQDFNHNLGWSVSLEPEMGTGFGYPVFEGEVVYDSSESCAYQQCGPMSEESALEESDVNDDGIGDLVIDDDDLESFMGYDGLDDLVIDDDLLLLMG